MTVIYFAKTFDSNENQRLYIYIYIYIYILTLFFVNVTVNDGRKKGWITERERETDTVNSCDKKYISQKIIIRYYGMLE